MIKNYLSQKVCIGGQCIEGPLPTLVGSAGKTEFETLGDLINKVVSFIIPLAAIILFFVLVWGGYDLMMSQGNPEKLKSAQAKITTGIIGFVLLILSYLIVKLISVIFGLGGGII